MGKPENLQSIGLGRSGPPDDLTECVERAVSKQIADEIDAGILTDAEYTADHIFDAISEYSVNPTTRECTPKYPEALDDINHLKLAIIDAIHRGKFTVEIAISPAVADAANDLLQTNATSRTEDRMRRESEDDHYEDGS